MTGWQQLRLAVACCAFAAATALATLDAAGVEIIPTRYVLPVQPQEVWV